MSNSFDFEQFKANAIEQLKAGVPLSGKDVVLAPLLENLLDSTLDGEMDRYLEGSEREKSLDDLEIKWGEDYPIVIKSWRDNWDRLTAYLHIPEQCRPLSKSNRLFVNLFRSIVGHTFVESHTFAMGITGKGYGRKNN